MAIKNMANREVCDAIFRDYNTGVPVLFVDYANTTTTELTGETVNAYGGWGHPARIAFNGEKGGTIAFEFQIQPFELYALMAGAEIENTATVCRREKLVAATDGKVTLAEAPEGKVNVFEANKDCDINARQELAAVDKVVTIPDAEEGDEFICYYEANITKGVKKIAINGKTFPKALKVDANTIYKTEDDEEIDMILRVYKCQPQSNFTLAHSNTGDPGTITLTCNLLQDADNNLIDMIAIGEDEEE